MKLLVVVVRGGILYAVILAACASGHGAQIEAALRKGDVARALTLYDRDDSPDQDALRSIAAVVLFGEAMAREERSRRLAMNALALAPRAAMPILRQLAVNEQTDGVTRARALLLLAKQGDAQARATLRAKLGDPNPQIAAAAVALLDPVEDVASLRELSTAPAQALRSAALERLRHAPPDAATLLALTQVARHDPAQALRAAALYALGHQGAQAVEVVEGRLDDVEVSVRVAAIFVLCELSGDRARTRLAAYLAAEPMPESIASAQALWSLDPLTAPKEVRAQLSSALSHPDGSLRSQAAMVLWTLRHPGLSALAKARLLHEKERSVRLSLALSLSDQAQSRAVLVALMMGDDVVAAEAAAELARRSEATAPSKLISLLKHKSPVVRASAARALAHDQGRAHDVRALLDDADVQVRVAAASAILSQGS